MSNVDIDKMGLTVGNIVGPTDYLPEPKEKLGESQTVQSNHSLPGTTVAPTKSIDDKN